MSILKKVILIDDDQVNNFVCESIIRNEGFAQEIISFEWAEDALNYLQQESSKGQAHFPDLIFLDINMPGMNGWTFIDEYRKLSPDTTSHCLLFMLSSAVDRKDILTAKSIQEVKEFFSKPLSPEILNIIREDYLVS
ncbi:response regulator [Pontibacter sp. E15-1]|uniref:response regulator n=1 Tax=Pontibacter sp. E15-1 TaxID=2919918 RepID=UPI001F4F9636|nr:response regulator [Pontibacter sp. E15-1]MCJ8166715.1 response regulator [Pontibacter sp. E15-1]